MKKWIIATGGVVLISSVITIFAQPPGGKGREGDRPDQRNRMRPEMGPMDRAERLGLTPEETAALKELRSAHQKALVDLQAAHKKARLDVRDQMSASPVDESALIAAIEAEGAADTAIKIARAKHMLAVRAIVGDEKAAALGRRMMDAQRGQRMDRPERPGPGDRPDRGPRGDRAPRGGPPPSPDASPDAE